jgi:hypothetical protein
MSKFFVNIFFFLYFVNFSFAQSDQLIYEQAYQDLNCMLNEECPGSFKEAVFIVENAYYSNNLDRVQFERRIAFLAELARKVSASGELIYNFPDREEVKKYAAIFRVMTDTVKIEVDSVRMISLIPYSYDFNDVWGHKDWSNMFVSKLLESKKGNCHSLPYLYKIIADEIGTKAHIATAPNHFFIKHQNKASGWYNTELTSGIFPIDAWLMASGYIHLNAVTNKLYLEALNEKQMLALSLIDLAQGYERKLGVLANLDFILTCCETALRFYPHYINAILLKAETRKKQFNSLMTKNHAKYPAELLHIKEAQELFAEMTLLYSQIHQLGYRKMPEDMYMAWLLSLKEERSKYENRKITNFKSSSH